MREFTTQFGVDGAVLPATCTVPAGRQPVGGIVTLHGATAPQRDFFLYEHLARVAAHEGWAVLRYDRRPVPRGTVPFDVQAADALAAGVHLRQVAQLADAPIGLWGVSQGAWPATMAAAEPSDVAFLILVGYSVVSPGVQMRYYTAGLLREHGFGEDALTELAALRTTFERFLRGEVDHTRAKEHIDQMRPRPWFEHAWVPEDLPPLDAVQYPGLFDFDPIDPLARTRCPLLAIWGMDDVEVPAETGRNTVTGIRAEVEAQTRCQLLDGVGHTLTVDDVYDVAALDPRYERLLVTWLADQQRGGSTTGG